LSISTKSIHRINKAVETQTHDSKETTLTPPKEQVAVTSSHIADTSPQVIAATSRITQNLPDYLL